MLDVKNCGKIAILRCPLQATLSHEMDVGRQKMKSKIAILVSPPQPFRTKLMLDVKNCGKIAILRCPLQPFRTKWTLDVKK